MEPSNTSRLKKCLEIVPATLSDYQQLSIFHYCGDQLGPVRFVYKIIEDHVLRRLSTPVVGIIVYGMPSANLSVRNRVTGHLFGGFDRATGLSLLNRNLLCIRRVIIDPRYRGLGLATQLVKDTLSLTGSPMVEALSVMGRIHPFFARAGMVAYETEIDMKSERLQTALETVGIDRSTWHNGQAVHKMIQDLPRTYRRFIESEIGRFVQKFTSQRNRPHSIERTEFIMGRLTAEPIYYLWTNPDKKVELKAS